MRLILDFLEDVVRRRAAVVGAGLSAAYAVQVAADRPELVRALGLVVPAGLDVHGDEPDVKDALVYRLLRLPVLGTSALNLYTSRAGLSHHLRREAYSAPERVDAATIDQLYRVSHQPGAHGALAAYLSGYSNHRARRRAAAAGEPALARLGPSRHRAAGGIGRSVAAAPAGDRARGVRGQRQPAPPRAGRRLLPQAGQPSFRACRLIRPGPRAGALPSRHEQPRVSRRRQRLPVPRARAAAARALARAADLRAQPGGYRGRRAVRLLRRPAHRQQQAARRSRADPGGQGPLPAVPHHARAARGAQGRLGHPRPGGRDRGREDPRLLRQASRSRSTASPPSTRPVSTACRYLRAPVAADDRAGRLLDRSRRRLLHLHATSTSSRSGGPSRPCTTRSCSRRTTRSSPTAPAAAPPCRATRWRRTTRTSTTRRSGCCSRCAPGQSLETIEGASWPVPAGLALVAWTTTPWTLLGHSGLAVHPELVYRVVEHPAGGGLLLFAEDLETEVVYQPDGKETRQDLRELPAVARVRGAELAGLRYDRPFATPPDETFEHGTFNPPPSDADGWCVFTADYVTATRRHRPRAHGAGLRRRRLPQRRRARSAVPAHGRRGRQDRGSARDRAVHRPVVQGRRPRGRCATCAPRPPAPRRLATATTTRSAGAATSRSSTTPRRAGSSAPPRQKAKLIALNQTIELASRAHRRRPLRQLARDDRRLGAVAQALLGHAAAGLGVRRSARTGRSSARSSELFAAAGQAAPDDLYDRDQFDPHRPFDRRDLSWPCGECGDGEMRRVEEVIDAWFDSGAMPFAQHHYPFENRELSRRASSRPTSSPRRSTRRAAGSTPCTCSARCSSTRWPTRPASCSATSTTSRGARCPSGSATSSTRWR